MQVFRQHCGIVVTMDRADVDTDQIIPKQFLKRIERSGFEEFLFFDWRYDDSGASNPDFELNQPNAAGAGILIARRNFGCGSSREHAVWALENYGIRVVIAESFADIFYSNCFQNGVLPIVLPVEQIDELFRRASGSPYALTVDLEQKTVCDEEGLNLSFDIDDFRRECLLQGLDNIAQTLQQESRISQYEERNADRLARN
ncbi:MAG TPA: 3-isopropylmalate dehydratase small subunit [Planctomycetes bacterium]|nr:3-isopropylmalate dehydratase small subunit [Planctomycetaceae bacterium]HIM30528.1 3-isopropylmalate dehydratase small subunit [Planctomycetota bacterium]